MFCFSEFLDKAIFCVGGVHWDVGLPLDMHDCWTFRRAVGNMNKGVMKGLMNPPCCSFKSSPSRPT